MIHCVLDLCCTRLGNNFRDRGVVGKFSYARKGVARGSEVINHDKKEPRADAGTLSNSSGDWFKVRDTIRAKLDTLGAAPQKVDYPVDNGGFYS